MHGLVYQLLSVENDLIYIYLKFSSSGFLMQISSDPKIEEETVEEELQFPIEPVRFI